MRAIPACDVITRDTSTVTSARRRRTRRRRRGAVRTTPAPWTRSSKPCPNDKNETRRRGGFGPAPVIRPDRQLSGCCRRIRFLSESSPRCQYPERSFTIFIDFYQDTLLLYICIVWLVLWIYLFGSLRMFLPDNRRLTVTAHTAQKIVTLQQCCGNITMLLQYCWNVTAMFCAVWEDVCKNEPIQHIIVTLQQYCSNIVILPQYCCNVTRIVLCCMGNMNRKINSQRIS